MVTLVFVGSVATITVLIVAGVLIWRRRQRALARRPDYQQIARMEAEIDQLRHDQERR